MPTDTLTAPPTSAPPSSPSPAQDAGPSTTAIHVTTASVDRGPAPEPPKKGSAQERMFAELRKKAGQEPETKPAVTPKSSTPEEGSEETTTETTETTTETPQPTTAPEKKGKVSPWKLVDEHKAARAKAEQELVDLRKTMVEPAKAKEIEEKYSAAEKRLQELEQEIKFVNYRKSQEYQEKYEVPYQSAWKKAMADLGELTVGDPNTGAERPIEPKDILELVNMDLRSARAKAVETYGDFADDVMTHRKEIRNLFEAQHTALEEARKGGTEREAQMQKQRQEQVDSLKTEIGSVWSEANKQAVEDERFGKLLKPQDGDEEGNSRLAKGFEMADRAFSVSPLDPGLTKDQRAEVIRLHAAVRNRSAAFGRVAYQNHQLESKIAALTEELNKFKNNQPGAGTPRPDKSSAPTSARDSVFAALRAKAQ